MQASVVPEFFFSLFLDTERMTDRVASNRFSVKWAIAGQSWLPARPVAGDGQPAVAPTPVSGLTTQSERTEFAVGGVRPVSIGACVSQARWRTQAVKSVQRPADI